jgi:hypothetical protein
MPDFQSGVAAPAATPPTQPTAMNKAFSIAVLVAGIVLLIFGINAHDSIASSAKEAVTGTPTDKSIWLIIGGISAILVGGFNSIRRTS